ALADRGQRPVRLRKTNAKRQTIYIRHSAAIGGTAVRNGKLQVGVVGVGGIGRDQHLPGWARVPFAEVVAVADISDEALRRASELFSIPHCFKDWKDLVALDDLDLIDVCTPNRTHAPISLAALEQGKHVLCEKPLGTTAEEVRAMQGTATQAGRVLMAAQHL